MVEKLPTYLLKAPPDAMGRWRGRAELAGVSFASFVRSALDAYEPGTVAGRENGTRGMLASDDARPERAPDAAAPQRAARPATGQPRRGRTAAEIHAANTDLSSFKGPDTKPEPQKTKSSRR